MRSLPRSLIGSVLRSVLMAGLSASVLLLVACGASSTRHSATTTPKARAKPAPAAPAAQAPTAAPVPTASLALAPQVDGGEIPREELLSVLAQGVGRFLQRIRVSAARDAKGRFAGWQLVELFPGETREGQGILQPGDTLLRINGQSVERPEQLKNVWDSLATSSELIFTVRRADQQSDVRYLIGTFPPLPPGKAPPIPVATPRPAAPAP